MNNYGYELYAEICNRQYYNFAPYGCETWDAYPTKITYTECLKTECWGEFSEQKGKKEGLKQDAENAHNEKLHSLYSVPTIRVIRRKMRRVAFLPRMGQMRNMYQNSWKKITWKAKA
jgi:hypothetical protein